MEYYVQESNCKDFANLFIMVLTWLIWICIMKFNIEKVYLILDLMVYYLFNLYYNWYISLFNGLGV